MPMRHEAVLFVDSVLKHDRSDDASSYRKGEMQDLINALDLAGFRPVGLIPGAVSREYNVICPFVVVKEDGGMDLMATLWLDSLFRRVHFGIQGQNRGELMQVVEQWIERGTHGWLPKVQG